MNCLHRREVAKKVKKVSGKYIRAEHTWPPLIKIIDLFSHPLVHRYIILIREVNALTLEDISKSEKILCFSLIQIEIDF